MRTSTFRNGTILRSTGTIRNEYLRIRIAAAVLVLWLAFAHYYPHPFAKVDDVIDNLNGVPIYFSGHNSRLFQLASHVHSNLRLGLLIKEFRARIDEPVQLVVGEPIASAQLAPLRHDPNAMMEYLRKATYALSPGQTKSYDLGYEFEARYKIGHG